VKRPFVILAGVAGALLLVGATWFVITLQKLKRDEPTYPAAISFTEPTVSAPLAGMRVTRIWENTEELFATLQPAVSLQEAVDLSLFNGFHARMTCEQASSRHGAPSGKWLDPYYRVEACFYDRPDGRISLCRVPNFGGYGWNTVGYPKECTFNRIFKDVRLLEQLRPWLPAYGEVSVSVIREGSGGVTVDMTAKDCTRLILTAREK
jgi:hypothetical protein